MSSAGYEIGDKVILLYNRNGGHLPRGSKGMIEDIDRATDPESSLFLIRFRNYAYWVWPDEIEKTNVLDQIVDALEGV